MSIFDKKTILMAIIILFLFSVICYLLIKNYFIKETMKQPVKVNAPENKVSTSVGKVIESEDFILDTEVHMPDTEVEPKKEIESFSTHKLTSIDDAFKLLNNENNEKK
jgi:hypothetical protein